jgi:hypothetical protein
MCFEQIGWTIHAFREDIKKPYCGDQEAAKFLSRDSTSQKVAGFYFFSIGPVAYLGHPIYLNQTEHEYWSWRRSVDIQADAPETLRQNPDLVVISGADHWESQSILHGWHYLSGSPVTDPLETENDDDYGLIKYLLAHGYRETHEYCGQPPMRSGTFAELCQFILQSNN